MTRENIIKTLSIVGMFVVVGVVVSYTTLGSPSNVDVPNGTEWVCTNPKCGYSFNMSTKELGEFYSAHPGEGLPCPKCNSPAVRAFHCDTCDKNFAPSKDGGASICPSCGKDAQLQQNK